LKNLCFSALVLLAVVFLASCGRKAAPRLPAYEQPPAPSSLAAIQRENAVILLWDYPRSKLRYVREFRVMRSEKILASTEETSYKDPKIETGKVYDYTVFAVSTTGIVSDATAQVRVETKEVPAAPEGLVAEVVKEGVSLMWSHSRGDMLFNIYRSPERDLNPLLPANPQPVSGTSYTDIPYASQTVYYTVRALVGGPARHEGPASVVVELKPEAFVPSPPNGVRATVAGEKVLLAWKESPEVWARSYRIYRSLDGEEFSLIGESRTPSFIDSEGLKGDLYYKVSAVGPAVEGAFSKAAIVAIE
jgi:fibronectin type 3 domain-containing protein